MCPAPRQVTVMTPRQSGKSTLLLVVMVARALARPGTRIVYTAQTRLAARKKLLDDWWPLVERSPLGPAVTARRQSGSEALTFSNGSSISLMSGTVAAGHGEVVDLGVLDEAWSQCDNRVEQSLRPAMMTRPGSGLLLVSTAGTMASLYLRGKVDDGRARAEAGDAGTTAAYLEWSAPDHADPGDPATWAACMPALGTTVEPSRIREDFELMSENDFKRAYLNQWTEGAAVPWAVVSEQAWAKAADLRARPRDVDRRAFGVAVAPDRRASAVAQASRADGGRVLVEVECYLPATDWVAPRLAQLHQAYRPPALVIDPGSPAGALIPDVEQARVAVTSPFTARDAAAACGMFLDYLASGRLVHRAQPELDAAVECAQLRSLSGGSAWDTRDGAVVCLSAASLALWGLVTYGNPRQPPYDLLRSVA
jgi:hypothetical protein